MIYINVITVLLFILALIASFALMKLLSSESKNLKIKHDTKKGFADLLNYASLVEDGIVLGKNGSLSVSYRYTCEDSDSSTAEDLDMLSARLNQVLRTLGDGWIMHVDSMRCNVESYSSPSASNFPDKVTRAIDSERRHYFNELGLMYESIFVVTFTYLPPKLMQQKFIEMMYETDGKEKVKDRTNIILKEFKDKIREIEGSLSLAVRLERLRSYSIENEDGSHTTYDAQLQYFNSCINGELQEIRLPDTPVFLDVILANQDFETGTIPKIGDKYIQVVALDGFPSESYSGILNQLSKVRCSCRWNTRFLFLDQNTSLNEIKKFQDKWKQKVRGIMSQLFNIDNGSINYDAANMSSDADDFNAEVNSGDVTGGYYTSVIVLMDSNYDLLIKNTEFVVKEITRLGFTARKETVNCVEAYLGSLPSDGYHNIRRPLIHTLNLAHMLPTSTIWTGSATCPCPFYPENSPALMYAVTDGASPFRFNLHVRDLGHTLILGPTGAGKSTLLATIVAQLRRYQGMTIYAFDKGMSMYALCKACGGSHFEICSEDSSLQFCPLQYIQTPSDRDQAAEWIISIMQLNHINGNGVITPDQIEAIKVAIESMYHNGIVTMSGFYGAVQNAEVKQIIKNYCGNSLMGSTLDGSEDNLALSDFTVFEMEEIMNQPDKYRIPILLYLFKRIQDGLKGQPAVIVLDEAWIMLSNEVFREKIREWLKVLRKANCAVIMATQSISDATNSGIMDVIAESTATKIFLPNNTAKNEDTSEMYRKLGLNSRQISIIANAVPKHDYYVVSSEGRRLFSLALQKLTLAFVAVSDKETISSIKTMEGAYGDAWVDHYLAEQNLYLKDYING